MQSFSHLPPLETPNPPPSNVPFSRQHAEIIVFNSVRYELRAKWINVDFHLAICSKFSLQHHKFKNRKASYDLQDIRSLKSLAAFFPFFLSSLVQG